MEILTIAGTVSRNPELRRTQGGDPILGFSLVIDQGKDRDGNRRDGKFFDVSVFGKRAESLQPHIKKGDKLAVSGRVFARAHEGKAYLGISVDQLTFMGGGQRSEEPQRQGEPANFDDSEIPFAPEMRG